MLDIVEVKFASGNRVRFGSSQGGGMDKVSRRNLPEKASETFEKAMGALGDVVKALETAVGKLEQKPEGVEIEFSASLSGDCDLWVVSGHGEAEFKVTLSWGKT
jgi:hypothetical protein